MIGLRPLRTATATIVALSAVAAPAAAQDWATRSFCEPETIAVLDAAFGHADLAEVEQRAAEIPNGTGRLWQITAPDGAVSHLWGTMHSSHRRVLDMPDLALDLIDGAELVALEIDPTFPNRESHDRYMSGDRLYRPARSNFRFEDLGLSPDLKQHIGRRFESLGWPATSVDDLTFGGLVDFMLYDPCEDFAAGVLPKQDSFIQARAYIEGTPILALEPVDRLSRKLDTPGNEGLARALIATYGVYLLPGSPPEARATSLALYTEGRIGMMMAWDEAEVTGTLGAEGPDLYARMTEYLVDERNRDFVNAAREALKAGNLFIAVGSFHLPGQNGMIELLRTEGFDVSRVSLPGEAP
ncbi:TraB/GumN family protein [Antarctobacter jejuensis]|uniref:TraB/GumN family protein n=1 Tax=Antarctobacter jejuensis TaxID=1439938 RepID=UPI003FD465F7